MNERNTEFLAGLTVTAIICLGWRMQANPPPIYITNFRLHHYQVGLGFLLLGITKKMPFWLASGSMLIIDDLDDMIKDINKL